MDSKTCFILLNARLRGLKKPDPLREEIVHVMVGETDVLGCCMVSKAWDIGHICLHCCWRIGAMYIYIYCSVLYSTPGVGLLLVLLAHPGLQELSAGFSPAFHVRLVKNGEGMVFRQLQACGERVGWNDRCDRTRVDPGWDRSP